MFESKLFKFISEFQMVDFEFMFDPDIGDVSVHITYKNGLHERFPLKMLEDLAFQVDDSDFEEDVFHELYK